MPSGTPTATAGVNKRWVFLNVEQMHKRLRRTTQTLLTLAPIFGYSSIKWEQLFEKKFPRSAVQHKDADVCEALIQ